LRNKIKGSRLRIIELRKLAHEAGIELQSNVNLEDKLELSKASTDKPELDSDPLNSIIFHKSVSCKPGWDAVLYEIASTELTPNDLSKGKPL